MSHSKCPPLLLKYNTAQMLLFSLATKKNVLKEKKNMSALLER